nr:MAG TPA: hypothetical protein [Caudoviricetes sp.]
MANVRNSSRVERFIKLRHQPSFHIQVYKTTEPGLPGFRRLAENHLNRRSVLKQAGRLVLMLNQVRLLNLRTAAHPPQLSHLMHTIEQAAKRVSTQLLSIHSTLSQRIQRHCRHRRYRRVIQVVAKMRRCGLLNNQRRQPPQQISRSLKEQHPTNPLQMMFNESERVNGLH